jgi:hypothetical protein
MSSTPKHPTRAEAIPAECRAVRELLEGYLDGELPEHEAERLARHVEAVRSPSAIATPGCADCARELRRAERLRAELRSLPAEPCPDEVVARVLAVARREPSGAGARTLRWRPAAGAAHWLRLGAVAAAAAALLWLGVRAVDGPAPRAESVQADLYSAEELARAEEELRLALSYVAAISRRSALTLRDDVLVGEVLQPSADALERAFGGQPETRGGDR